MTLDTYTPSNNYGVATVADQSSKGAARIVQWAASAEAAHQLAEVLCRTSFCPEQFRNKPGETTAAILAGGEVGLSPMASMRAFDIIQGNAAARAITLRAVVLSFGHEIELLESTAQRCRMRGRRRGSEGWQEVTWTIERARQMKLVGKQNWQLQPATMLLARTTSELARLIAADAILGIGYAVEELEDMMAEQKPTGPRKVQRQKAQPKAIAQATDSAEDEELLGMVHRVIADAGDPEESGWALDRKPTEEPPKADPNPPASAAQLKMLGVNWSRIGVTDDLERRTYTGLLVGRDIGETTKNLNVAEASGLIDKLTKIKDREALEQAIRSLEEETP